jgi:hypothetical protein
VAGCPAVAPGGRVPRAPGLLLRCRSDGCCWLAGRQGLQAGDRGGDLVGPGPALGESEPQAADAAYHGPALKQLPPGVSWTTRLPRNAVLYDLAPPRVRKPGRPPRKGPGWAPPPTWPPPRAGPRPPCTPTAETRPPT